MISTLLQLALSPAGKAVGALLAIGMIVGAVYAKGRSDGRAAGRQAQMADTIKAYEARKGIDDEIDGMDRVAVCLSLGGLRDQCDELRRLDEAAGRP